MDISDDGSIGGSDWQTSVEILLNIGFELEFEMPIQCRRRLTLFDDSSDDDGSDLIGIQSPVSLDIF